MLFVSFKFRMQHHIEINDMFFWRLWHAEALDGLLAPKHIENNDMCFCVVCMPIRVYAEGMFRPTRASEDAQKQGSC